MKLIILVIAVVLAVSGSASAISCSTHSDCPGYVANSFCHHVECDTKAHLCVEYPNPCSGACLEASKQCVECLSNDDCASNLCDNSARKCILCGGDADCPTTDWCHGNQEVCDRTSGHCVPGQSPCPDPDTCIASLKQCFSCQKDVDCGQYDFCTNPVVCDRTTGACLKHSPYCSANEICDSEAKRCVECVSDNDCQSKSDVFCQAPVYCDASSGRCAVVKDASDDPCVVAVRQGEVVAMQRCDESRKMCVDEICLNDDDCDDGVCENGKETCQSHHCVKSYQICEPTNNSTHDGKDIPDSLLGAVCSEAPDCASQGYLCKIVSSDPPLVRECRPCNNDAECSDGNPDNGEEACNLESGQCQWEQVVGQKNVDSPSSQSVEKADADSVFGAAHYYSNVTSTTGILGGPNLLTDGFLFLLIVIAVIIVILVVSYIIYNAMSKANKKSKKSKGK